MSWLSRRLPALPRHAVVRASVLAGLSTLGLALALGLGAPDPGIAERSYAGVLGIVAWSLAVAWLASPGRSGAASAARPSGEPPGLGVVADEVDDDTDATLNVLVDLERNLRLGRLTIGDFQALVRPRLVELASSRLSRLGMPIGSPQARIALGGAYELVDPAAPQPDDRSAPGVSLDAVAELLTRLEALS